MSSVLTVVYWRDIPAQVIARGQRRGRTARRALSERFQEAIDRAAMRAGLSGSDAYLAEWRRGDPLPGAGDPEAEADALAHALENDFTDGRLAGLVASGGRSDPPDASHNPAKRMHRR